MSGNRIRKNNKPRTQSTLLLLLFAVLVGIVVFIGTRFDGKEIAAAGSYSNDTQEEIPGLLSVGGKWYIPKENMETVLIMGTDEADIQQDSGSYKNTDQADFLMLVAIDKQNESYSMLQINRDTMTDVPILGVNGKKAGTALQQLALAHTYGSGMEDSCKNTADAVSNLLYGIDITHYTAISMPAINIINDAVGGVTVTIEDDFSELDPTMVQGETITLQGSQAETFVRGRKLVGEQTNVERMERQKVFLTALQQKMQQRASEDSLFLANMVLSISDYLVSDMSVQQMSKFANMLNEYDNTGVQQIAGESIKGEVYMEFYVDETALQQQVLSMFYEPYTEKE